ncbi:MAG: roadblock/LC7 domain-containing protein [Candidatus Thorarchaeota archaeon]
MADGKMERLGRTVDQLIKDSPGRLSGCVVTNERGLVVAEKSLDGSSSQTLAAMISLLSDTAIRVNDNLGFGHPRTASIRALGALVAIHQFQVQNKWFRIGAVLIDDNDGRFWPLKRHLSVRRVEKSLGSAAQKIRSILESS